MDHIELEHKRNGLRLTDSYHVKLCDIYAQLKVIRDRTFDIDSLKKLTIIEKKLSDLSIASEEIGKIKMKL